MSTIPRPSFTIVNNPMFMWDPVPGATYYKLKMTNQATQKTIWEVTLSSSEVNKPSEPCQTNYPDGVPTIDQDSIYLLNGEAYDESYLLKQGKVELLMFDSATQHAVEGFESLLSLDSEPLGKLEEMYLMAKEAIFNSVSLGSPRPWRGCIMVPFI
jgi:hypothetical protein